MAAGGLLHCCWGCSDYVSFLQSLLSPNFMIVFSGGNSAPKATAPLFRNRFVLSAASKLLAVRVPFGTLGGDRGWLPGSAWAATLKTFGIASLGPCLAPIHQPGYLGIAPLGPCLAAIHQPCYLGVASWCLLPGLRFGSHNTSVDSASKS